MKELFEAIKAGDLTAVKALLDREPELVNACDQSGLPAFTAAKYNRQEAIAQLLRERGAKLDIHAAAITGDEARVRELIQGDKSAVSTFSHDGWTPLHLAVFFGHAACAKALVEAGAAVNERAKNAMENMPIHAAAAGRSADAVVILIENGADINARQHGGWTALHAAAQNGDASIAHVLIGAGADVKARADNNQSALDLALTKGHQDMVDILEHYGAQ
jgi:uncharacterized protein